MCELKKDLVKIDLGMHAFSLALHGAVMAVISFFVSLILCLLVTLYTQDTIKEHVGLLLSCTVALWVVLHWKLVSVMWRIRDEDFEVSNDNNVIHGLEMCCLIFVVPYTIFYMLFPTGENASPAQISILFGSVMLFFSVYHALVLIRFFKHILLRDVVLVSATLIVSLFQFFR